MASGQVSVTGPVHVVGGGLAGSEAAWQLASAGVPVILHEMRGSYQTDAHSTDGFAELVCSNSFRSDDHTANAVGVLHEEMRRLGSLIMRCGDEAAVPAGSALAVDRDIFSAKVTKALESHDLIEIRRERIERLPGPDDGRWIFATGPLTAIPLAEDIVAATGEDQLAFFDAIAPIVHHESIDLSTAWYQSRWDKGDGKDYINCPMDRDQYEAFIDALLTSEKDDFRDWEKDTPYFEGCMPIEVMAERGRETLRYGPMKPVGLTNAHTGGKAYAVVQLRQDNALGTLWNMVGFQTKMKYGEQVRVFRTIPGLENAEFARLGGLHRNTFIRSPEILDETLRLRVRPNIRFAGQVTGCEGYIESAAVGLMAARFAAAEARGLDPSLPPRTTAHGALLAHITGDAEAETFQPMNVNFGLFPPLAERHHKRERKAKYAERALRDMDDWIGLPKAAE